MSSVGISVTGSSLVGRRVELAVVDRRLTEAADGRGGMVLLAGEPGIGKSRLAEEAGGRARGRGFRVVWGRCRETEGAPPFWPWSQVLRGVVADRGGETPAGLRPLLESGVRAAGREDRFQLFDAAASVFLDEARRRSLLLVLDDLHRADHSSLELLRFLSPAARDARLLVVGTYRDTEVRASHPLFKFIGEAAGGVGVDLLTLSGLTLQDTVELMAGHLPAGAELRAEELHERSAGNPFFLTEIIRLWPDIGEAVPPTVSAAISARVERLPRATRRVLGRAAVLGREFRPELLAALDGVTVAEIDHRLASAVAAGLVLASADQDGGYRFVHVLVREAIYGAIPPCRRTELHELVVRTLDAPAGADLAGSSEAASHAMRTVRTQEERRRACRLAVRAAGLARDRLGYEEAADWFGRALELGVDNDEERFALLVELGRVAGLASRVDTARSAYMQAWALAEHRGWNSRLAQVALGLGDVIVSAGTVDAGLVRMLERSLERADPADRRARIRLTARLAVEIYWSARLEEARRLAAEAVAAARRLADRETLAVSLAAQQFVLRGAHHLSQRIRLGAELVRHARALGDEHLELNACRLLLADRLQVDPGAAAADFEELAVLAERTRRPLAQWYVMVNRVLWATMSGRFEEALGVVAVADAFGRRLGARPTAVYTAFQRFAVLWHLGRAGEAEHELRMAVCEYPVVSALRCALTVSLASSGRQEEAGALLADLVADDCRAVPPDALWTSGVAMLAIAANMLDRPGEAAILHRLLLPHSGTIAQQGVVVWWGSVDHYLGLTATVLGRCDEAEAAFVSALRLHETWAAAPLVRASLDGLATTLRRRGGREEQRPASALVDHRLPELTGRETEVLRLLAAGAANKEIARRLNISIHTVERHVANLYSKIGVTNRAEATAFALRLDV